MKILKFGGTSVGTAENIKRVKEIIKHQDEDVIVVISALDSVTDAIWRAAQLASAGDKKFYSELEKIEKLHEKVTAELFGSSGQIIEIVRGLLDELKQILTGIMLVGELTCKTLDRIAGIGERISSQMVAHYIEGAVWVDTALLIRTDSNFGKALVDFETTNRLIKEEFGRFKGVAVVPGFIAKNKKGEYTTLGRGGSDYTAAIIGAALSVNMLEIWTNVDGFMTADPKVISKAYTIPELTYSEAMELSHFGAKVIYPPTILPVYQKNIPIKIKNTFSPDKEGSLIVSKVDGRKDRPIKGISSISGIVLVTLQGLGMVGVTGISMRLFSTLAKVNVNVILISQASSENSISVAIDEHSVKAAERAIREEFDKEIALGRISNIHIERDLSIAAIVGENMKHTTGIAGKLFSTIGRNGINVIAIAQGASELNISWVVKNSELRKTLNVVHESFFLSENVELNVFLMGTGSVGGNLLEQLQKQQKKLLDEKHLKIKLTGIANTKKMLFRRDGIDISEYKNELDSEGRKSSLSGFVREMDEMNIYNSVFVDCTASEEVSLKYRDILSSNISVVTANKVAASSSFKNYSELKLIAKRKGVKFLFETNVGAGLPIINTLNDLVNSGDRILKIEAVLSGTLNFIFNTISPEVAFSKTVKMARELGYSEPDPRIDLSGVDVARKILILAREAGYPLEMDDITIERFVPDEMFAGSADSFWRELPSLDEDFEERRKKLEAENKKWRFVARFENNKAHIGLQEVGTDHPFYDLQASNNLVIYTTERYNEFPMLIKGYGAGASVTAAGVFADIIKVANI
ncbi:MAG: bifunctional aspartate kinase/homoserine dehydrogenase I [Prolixibacteraceae bacterium]|jgi:aspartokinase/homoserine dehydrogenase 1|nr:bifunctional aspartate kinase/homoserine dehydrogenase I [Prolixibacteraceae bacterium]NLO01392.1 bifunctional aspartate kinase/homoserine dehydrogenase I [Bacteroidales bacterium]